ncbi:hypothetical protein [Shinella sp. G-2]|uniref:hypothetical protein n=1 Tax=Shinella sp. G-2 TaxID=3133141 RepID=UPI003D00C6EE
MQRKRFQLIIAEVLGPDAPLGGSPSASQLAVVAARLGDGDIADIRATLDDLAAEKDMVPDWDGDTQDDIARAEATLSQLLRMVARQEGI